MKERLNVRQLKTDVLIIGGGTAGCYAALTISRNSDLKVLVVEKANIKRSGCLAAGVNALNAYITKGHDPQFYVDYATKDAAGIVREDLLYTMSEHLNEVTADLEKMGLVILKDENGDYVARGSRNIKINGENIKPILAKAAQEAKNVTIMNHVNMTDLLVEDGKVYGAVGFGMQDLVAYDIRADKVLIATGGAAGLYRPNNPGFSRHKMWYPPFNTGAGYSMGIRAGAEMTSFEMRFIALRCKDTIAPTGTIAQGVGAKQVNARGEIYETKYGLTTSERVYGTVKENQLGHGPCYLDTTGITEDQDQDLLKAYLNMAPSQTLKWIESGKNPSQQGVEIEGTEPYVVGGHTASGFWVNTERETTIDSLYAAGDVAGGCPQKYVTGALVEGELAARDIVSKADQDLEIDAKTSDKLNAKAQEILNSYEQVRNEANPPFTVEELEEAMQKVMDEYAGGISSNYEYNEFQLQKADQLMDQIIDLSGHLRADDQHQLMFVYELRERLVVCKALIAHLLMRKETRWHAFNENMDHPDQDSRYFRYVNSKMEDDQIKILYRDIVHAHSYHFEDQAISAADLEGGKA
ncbi:MAG: adenylyl-sulfate reductase subunit alpha [Lachnospiraceae bacterium]|nr:adenylyl-sulfate reductase subunit alpha [Lachnospiraceae bacterium]